MSWLLCLILLAVGGIVAPKTTFAQPPRDGIEHKMGEESEQVEGETIEDPHAKGEVIRLARQAFVQGDFLQLYELLGPLVSNRSISLTKEEQKQVLPWYAAGLIVAAQQEPNKEKRQEYYDKARAAFVTLLKNNPNFELEELLYPEQVVVLFDSIEGTYRRNDGGEDGGSNVLNHHLEPVYIQKEVIHNQFALVFFPFGIGQFQNDDLVLGTLAASLQVASLVTNISSFVVLETLRQPNGFYHPKDLSAAKAWRTTMYTSLGVFVATYIASVVQAWLQFKDERINIRTLDAPPDELRNDTAVSWQIDFDLPSYEARVDGTKDRLGGGIPSPLSLGLTIKTSW